MGKIAEGWIIETAVTGGLALILFVLSIIQIRLEKVYGAKFLQWLFHRANLGCSLLIATWALDIQEVFNIYPGGVYFFFAVNVGNWIWTEGIYYLYATERAIAQKEKKAVSAKVALVYGFLVILSWPIGYLVCIVEFIQNRHAYFWIYSIYMSVACAIANVVGFVALRQLRQEILMLKNNLGITDKKVLNRVGVLWLGNTVVLTAGVVGFAVTADEHYQTRNHTLTNIDNVEADHWTFTRRLFWLMLSLQILAYYTWIVWLPLCAQKSHQPLSREANEFERAGGPKKSVVPKSHEEVALESHESRSQESGINSPTKSEKASGVQGDEEERDPLAHGSKKSEDSIMSPVSSERGSLIVSGDRE